MAHPPFEPWPPSAGQHPQNTPQQSFPQSFLHHQQQPFQQPFAQIPPSQHPQQQQLQNPQAALVRPPTQQSFHNPLQNPQLPSTLGAASPQQPQQQQQQPPQVPLVSNATAQPGYSISSWQSAFTQQTPQQPPQRQQQQSPVPPSAQQFIPPSYSQRLPSQTQLQTLQQQQQQQQQQQLLARQQSQQSQIQQPQQATWSPSIQQQAQAQQFLLQQQQQQQHSLPNPQQSFIQTQQQQQQIPQSQPQTHQLSAVEQPWSSSANARSPVAALSQPQSQPQPQTTQRFTQKSTIPSPVHLAQQQQQQSAYANAATPQPLLSQQQQFTTTPSAISTNSNTPQSLSHQRPPSQAAAAAAAAAASTTSSSIATSLPLNNNIVAPIRQQSSQSSTSTRVAPLPPSSSQASSTSANTTGAATTTTATTSVPALTSPQFSEHLPEFPTGLPTNKLITRITSSLDKSEQPPSSSSSSPNKSPKNNQTSSASPDLQYPELESQHLPQLQAWIERDISYQKRNLAERVKKNKAIVDLGRNMMLQEDWLGRHHSSAPQDPKKYFRPILPTDRAEAQAKGRKGKDRKRFKVSKKQLHQLADLDEVLCPIRLDLDYEGYKLRDTFTWNIRDTITPVEDFASNLCDDMLLPKQPFAALITSAINEQLEESRKLDFDEYVYPTDTLVQMSSAVIKGNLEVADMNNNDGNGNTNDGNEEISGEESDSSAPSTPQNGGLAWWKRLRKRLRPTLNLDNNNNNNNNKNNGETTNGSHSHTTRPVKRVKLEIDSKEDDNLVNDDVLDLEDFNISYNSENELRILIKIDITLDDLNLADQLEWDLSEPLNSPEEFADIYTAELGLGGEFRTAVAHSIREQVDVYVKSLGLIEHKPGHLVSNDDLRNMFRPVLQEAIRGADLENEFSPRVEILTADLLERSEKERERDVRRKRRQGRGGVGLGGSGRDGGTVLTGRRRDGGGRDSGRDGGGSSYYASGASERLNNLAYLGANLPDREPVKTNRTLVPKPGSSMPTVTVDENDNTIPPIHEIARCFDIVRKANSQRILSGFTSELLFGGASEEEKARIMGMMGIILNGSPSSSLLINGNSNKQGPKRKDKTLKQPPLVITPSTPRSAILARSHKKGMAAAARAAKKQEDEEAARAEEQARKRASAARASRRIKEDEEDEDGEEAAISTVNAQEKDNIKIESSDNGRTPQQLSSSSVETMQPLSYTTPSTSNPPLLPPAPMAPYPTPSHRPPNPSSASTTIAPSSSSTAPAPTTPSTTTSATTSTVQAPNWLLEAVSKLRQTRPDDSYEVIRRPPKPNEVVPEWRLRCLDCPGKLYTPGPGETLDNFMVHVRNRVHLANVDKRRRGTQ